MGIEQDSAFYDTAYKNGGSGGKYFKEPEEISVYYQIWKFAADYINTSNIKKIIDFGCGPGHFSTLLNDRVQYLGYDFSKIAISQARNRNTRGNIKFKKIDLLNYAPSKDNGVFYTSFEFFEHISFDLEIISSLKEGSEILFSVPNHDSISHVRFFESQDDVIIRYSQLLQLQHNLTIEYGNNKKIFLYRGKRI